MMTGMKKKRMILSMMALAGLFFSHARVSAATTEFPTSFGALSASLYDKGTPLRLHDIIVNYCDAVLQSSAFVKDGFTYTAKQSAFVHLLCENGADRPSSFFSPETSYFHRTTFKQLGFQTFSDTSDLCSPMSNDCDLATNIPNLFNAIITDYVNMKQTNVYGLAWNFTTNQEMEDQINLFSSGYFNGIQICKTTDRAYPKTCAMMKWYLKNARNLLSDVTVFNASWILALQKSFDPKVCATRDDDYNIFLCGLYGDASTSMVSFVNLTYNELFYYRLFASYYILMLQKNPGTLISTSQNNDLSTIQKKFSSQYIRSKTALSLTFRMMRDTYMAFPFHVGFSMYQEDLDGFWKLLANIATPIYTLYDKLRNVQKPQ